MKLRIFILCLVLGFTVSDTLQAQSRKRDPLDDKGSFTQRLWYGTGAGLNFGGNQNTSAFTLALFPMVGYKLLPFLSVGPRIGGSITVLSANTSLNERKRFNIYSYEAGLFARAKFLQTFFVQTEYNRTSNDVLFQDGEGRIVVNPVTKEVVKERESSNGFLIGGGYNAADGGFGYEIGLYYNLLVPEDAEELPIVFRAGLTWKF